LKLATTRFLDALAASLQALPPLYANLLASFGTFSTLSRIIPELRAGGFR
jgi:hypothetical protein